MNLSDSYRPGSLVEILRRRADSDPDKRAYTYLERGEEERQALTYAELDMRARAVGVWLQKAGFKGERALLLFQPGIDFVTAFFGCLYAGTVAVPANLPRWNRKLLRLHSIVQDARPGVTLTTSDLLPKIQSAFAEAPQLGPMAWLAVDELVRDLSGDAREPEAGGQDLAFVQYTSGSTSAPKGVMVSHENILHNCSYLDYIAENDEESVAATWLPHFHDMGLIDGILQPLYRGYPCYMMSPLAFLQKPIRWLNAITRYKVTNSGGPNFAFDLCARKVTPEQKDSLDLGSWRMAYNGAEPVRRRTLEEFAAAFAPCGFRWESFYPVYGMAEATLVVSSGRRKDPPLLRNFDTASLEDNRVLPVPAERKGARALVGCGPVSCGMESRIVDPETLKCHGSDQVGEIWLRGPSVTRGYWERPDATLATFHAYTWDGQGPFLRTGDLGFVLEGELFISGRLKDLIILGGRNHHPQDIEMTVEESHPAVRPSCCAAFTVEVEGEEKLIVAVEVGRQRGVPEAEVEAAVVRAARQAVAEQHDIQVHRVVVLAPGEIPKTSSGKLQRHACRSGFLDQQGG